MDIQKLRKKLDEIIAEFGVDSKQAYKMSVKMDEAINEYMNTVEMKEEYEKSKEAMRKFQRENGRRPTKKEWNQVAKEGGFLSHVSMRIY